MRLDESLRQLEVLLGECPAVSICYFLPDQKKEGGVYQTVTGTVRRIDRTRGIVQFTDLSEIPICEIIETSFEDEELLP